MQNQKSSKSQIPHPRAHAASRRYREPKSNPAAPGRMLYSEPQEPEINPYEHVLVDHTAPIMGIPDVYPHPTAKLRIKTEVTLPWSSLSTSAIIGKSLSQFIQVPGTFSRQTTTGPILALNHAGYTALCRVGDNREVGHWTTTQANCRAAKNSTTSNFSDPDGNYENVSVVNNADASPCQPGDTFYAVLPSVDTTAAGWKLYLYTQDATGAQTITGGTATAGDGTKITLSVTAPAGAVTWSFLDFARNTGAGVLTFPDSVTQGLFTHASTQAGISYPIGKADGSDLATLLTSNGKYRVVACQALAQYLGDQESGGRLVIGQMPTSDLEAVPIPTVSNLSIIPGFYAGRLNNGGYCFRKPLDLSEQMFEDLDNPGDDTGSLICVAAAANDAAGAFISLQVWLTIELQTQNQIFSITTNLVDPFMIMQAHRNLADFGNAMENPSHFSVIAKKLWGDAKKVSAAVARTVEKWGPLALQAAELFAG